MNILENLKEKLVFIVIFSSIAFITLQIPFSKLAGSNISFTLFDFFAPMVGAFLGSWLGVVTIFLVEIANFIFKQTPVSTASIIRLFPILFASVYFSSINNKKFGKLNLFVPFICIALFVAHPIGRTVWYYSLFWLIPVLAYFKKDFLPIKSLGATFTAHAVGGAAWIWALSLPASVWNSLIPLVVVERILFAIGISVSYIITKHTLSYLISKKFLPKLHIGNVI